MNDTTQIHASNGGLKFVGYAVDGYDIVQELEAMRKASGGEWSKCISDFSFAIEVALQDAGFLDDNFEPVWSDEKLIAAAPELLASLDRMVNWVAKHTIPTEQQAHWPDIEKARAAIAKATGD